MGRKKTRRVLSTDELKLFEKYAAIRLPLEQVAALFDMSIDTLKRIMQKQDAARASWDQGRAKASSTARSTLWQKAFDQKNFQAMKFWCQTQEGFKTTDVVEIKGLEASNITDEELKERTQRFLKLMGSRLPNA